VIDVEQLSQTATAVPVTHLAVGLAAFEQLKDMAAERGHPGTTTDVDHFRVSVLDEKLAVRTADRRLITGFKPEDVAAHLARRSVLRRPRRRRRDADVEHDDSLLARVVRH